MGILKVMSVLPSQAGILKTKDLFKANVKKTTLQRMENSGNQGHFYASCVNLDITWSSIVKNGEELLEGRLVVQCFSLSKT